MSGENMPQLSREQRELIDHLCSSALELDPDRRFAHVRDGAGGDEAVEREVLSLLDLVEQGDSDEFLATPILEGWTDTAGEAGDAALAARALLGGTPPERVGHYTIIREIGHGGMGTVYEAEQENPRRKVALKMLRGGLATRESLRRFELEIRLLARLQHPGIGQIYEAGTTSIGNDSVPYFAMEYVRGEPLHLYAGRQTLPVEDRLRLVAYICDAVQYAHQNGVLHRDLKPANILVDAQGKPKVLDFGVGRLLTEDDQPLTIQTAQGEIVGTLPYMSPEQVGGRSMQLDTRSDVYALGVILYELLGERLPNPTSGLSIAEAARAIQQEDAPRLGLIRAEFRGDVETIVAKALEKEPDRRYRSAAELADDIRRHLQHQPVEARPRSASYQLRVFARRNRGLVVGATIAFAALLVGLVVSLALLYDTERARVEAEQRHREARAINDFLNKDILSAADPEVFPQSDEITVREVLDRAAGSIAGRFGDEPMVEASIRRTIGVTYRKLGHLDLAVHHLERALELQRPLGDDHEDTIALFSELGWAYVLRRDDDKAGTVLEDAFERAERVLGHLDELTLSIRNNLATALENLGRIEEAEEHFEICLRDMPVALGQGSWQQVTVMGNLAGLYSRSGRLGEALRVSEDALVLSREHLGRDHVRTLAVNNSLGSLYVKRGDYKGALPIFEETLRLRETILGDENPATLTSMNNLAFLYKRVGRFDDAYALNKKTFEARKRVLGERHPQTLISLNNVAADCVQRGDLSEAVQRHRLALEIRTEELGTEHADTLVSRTNLAQCLRKLGRLPEAESLYRETHAIQSRTIGATHPNTLATLNGIADTLLEQGRGPESLATFESLFEHIDGGAEVDPVLVARYRTGLGRSLAQLGRYEEAEAELRPAHSFLEEKLGAGHPLTLGAVRAATELFEAWNRAAPDPTRAERASQWRFRAEKSSR